MQKGKRIRLYGSFFLFLLLVKVATIFEPITLFAPDELKEIALFFASQNGIIVTNIKTGADLILSLTDGVTVGFEPIALIPDGDQIKRVPYLEKKPTEKALSVSGLFPYDKEYPEKREIKVKKRELSFLERIWQGSRAMLVHRSFKQLQLKLEPVKVALIGDIMLGRKVGEYIKKEGPNYPFKNVYNRLKTADITFANLETPTCVTGEFINLFRAHPSAIEGLVTSGIDVVSLANNHILDYHQECMLETWEHLSKVGIKQIGSGMSLKEATEGVILEVNGLRVGFLAYTETWFLYSRAGIKWVAEDYPGVAPIDKVQIVKDIKRLKQIEKADIVIVSLHWGIEYSLKVTKEEELLAKAIIDAGGDVVFGHHPHVIKPWGYYKEKPVFYSVGNFIFDPLKPPLTEKGLLVELVYLNGLRDLQITVTQLNNCQVELTELLPPRPNDIIN